MAAFPSSLRFPDGTVARRDPAYAVACLAQPARSGAPVLTDAARARLKALNLVVDGDPGPGADPAPLFAVNHGPRLIWLRALRQTRSTPKPAAVGKALGRRLAWVAPAYRLPKTPARDALFCARPDVLLMRPGAGAEQMADRLARKFRLREEPERSRHLRGWRCFSVPDAARANAIAITASFRGRNGAPELELDYVPHRSPRAFTPNDTYFGDQWGMTQVGAPAAWDIETGRPGVVVAVLDSGCDLDHADLRHAYASRGVNVADPTLDGSPVVHAPTGTLFWHGTAVAGVVAAGLNNALGVGGLASGCRLLPVAVPDGSTVEVAAAVDYAVTEGAAIVNMSNAIGSFWFEMYVRASIDAAVAAGRLVCAAAGNGDASPLVVPARYAPVMACGGSDRDDRRWRTPEFGLGSHFGDEVYLGDPAGVSVVAPAVDIVSTDITGADGFTPGASPPGDYLHRTPTIPAPFGATSAATPHVSGAAALLMSAYPALTAIETRRVLERTAEKAGGYSYADVPGYPHGSRHPEVGYGRLNVFRALDLGDVMIRDWPGDDGVEPSTPPGGNYFSYSDIVIRPGDDGVFRPDAPDMSGVFTRGVDHTASVRVVNVGPADARGVRVDLRATPWVGLEFVYPEDWTASDALHVQPAAIDAGPFAVPAGAGRIATFRFSAAQVETMAGWSDMRWHPCLLGSATAVNDYAFADAPAGASLQMRRNNLAQRNLTFAPITGRSAGFPFVVGHPATKDPRLTLVVEAGALPAIGEVFLVLEDAGRAFPAARKAGAFGKGAPKPGRVAGAKPARLGRASALRLDAPRAIVELVRPARARFALRLAVRLAADPPAGRRFPVVLTQFVGQRPVGGAAVVFASR